MSSQQLVSRHGLTQVTFAWRVVELWTLSAEDLFAANDVGLVPWIPLAQFAGPPEALVQRCRERIDQQAAAEERDNLLAVTQVMTRLRYNDPSLLTLLGGSRAVIESPLIQELMAQNGHEYILQNLETRFGAVPPELAVALRTILDKQKLRELHRFSLLCTDLAAFHAQVSP